MAKVVPIRASHYLWRAAQVSHRKFLCLRQSQVHGYSRVRPENHLCLIRCLSQTPPPSKLIKVTNSEEFLEHVMKSNVPVIVNFHADWCRPCHGLTPRLTAVVTKAKNVKLCNLDIDENPQIAAEFSVQAVPAVVAIYNGMIVDKFVGLVDIDKVEKFVENLDQDK